MNCHSAVYPVIRIFVRKVPGLSRKISVAGIAVAGLSPKWIAGLGELPIPVAQHCKSLRTARSSIDPALNCRYLLDQCVGVALAPDLNQWVDDR